MFNKIKDKIDRLGKELETIKKQQTQEKRLNLISTYRHSH